MSSLSFLSETLGVPQGERYEVKLEGFPTGDARAGLLPMFPPPTRSVTTSGDVCLHGPSEKSISVLGGTGHKRAIFQSRFLCWFQSLALMPTLQSKASWEESA